MPVFPAELGPVALDETPRQAAVLGLFGLPGLAQPARGPRASAENRLQVIDIVGDRALQKGDGGHGVERESIRARIGSGHGPSRYSARRAPTIPDSRDAASGLPRRGDGKRVDATYFIIANDRPVGEKGTRKFERVG